MRITKKSLQQGITEKGWQLKTISHFDSHHATIIDVSGEVIKSSDKYEIKAKWSEYATEVCKPIKKDKYTLVFRK